MVAPSPRKAVGIWIRVSTEDQSKGDSPEHHERRARSYAESKDWQITEVYRLAGVSGKAVSAHAETQRMLKDVASGHISGLIFSKLARLARNTKELLDFADRFREAGADLVSLQESIDTSTPAGRLFYTMIAAMAQWEREEIAERITATVALRAKLGKPINGKSSFGYCWKDRKLVANPDEAPVLRLLFELFLEHRRKKRVAKILNERGYRTRDGHPWSDTTIERLLRDPVAKGQHRANYTTRTTGKYRAIKPEQQWVWTQVDAAVSEDLWQQCNDILDHRKAKYVRVGKRPVHLFAGLTYCHCGTKMYVMAGSGKYICQGCRNKIPVVDLEVIFCEQLNNSFASPTEVARHLEQADEGLVDKSALLDSLRGDSAQVQRDMQKAYDLYAAGQIDASGFGHFYKPLKERSDRLAEELPRLQAEVDLLKINHLSSDRVVNEARNLHNQWKLLTRDEKQRIVESVTEKIVVGKNEIDISLCHLPSSEESTKEQRKLTPAAEMPAAPPAACNLSTVSPAR